MRVVIHGGMHKTGTTAVQDVLARHHAELAAEGVCYPDCGASHHARWLNVKLSDWSPQPIFDAIEQARREKAELLLLSAESVSTLSGDQFRKLTECFSGHDLKYIFSFRNWLSYLPSRYQQYCKRRDSQTFSEYVHSVASSLHVDHRYDLVLSRALASGTCTVAAISYDDAMRTDGNIVRTVLGLAGVREAVASELTSRSGKLNVSEPWQRVEQMRLLNGIAADRLCLPQDDLCRSMLEQRPPEGFFDFGRKLKGLPPQILSELGSVVENYSTVLAFKPAESFVEAEQRLLDQFADHFANACDDRLFPPSEPVEVMFADRKRPA